MVQRLTLSREVAWIKYGANLPVRDAKREAAVLDSMASLAHARGMDVSVVRSFFAAQIDASCAEQESLIRKWKAGAPLPAGRPRELQGAVRRDIDAVNVAMLDALAGIHSAPMLRWSAIETLGDHGFDAEAVRLATAPL
jgi:chorismate mutase-like protein